MRVSKLPASQQLVGTVNPAFDQPRTPALPLQIVCRLLRFGSQLHHMGLHLTTVPSHTKRAADTESCVGSLPLPAFLSCSTFA